MMNVKGMYWVYLIRVQFVWMDMTACMVKLNLWSAEVWTQSYKILV